jgi:hypothetical protein
MKQTTTYMCEIKGIMAETKHEHCKRRGLAYDRGWPDVNGFTILYAAHDGDRELWVPQGATEEALTSVIDVRQ